MPKKLDCRLKINKSKKSCVKTKSSKKKNCPKGSRRNPKTGRCVKSKSVKPKKSVKVKKSTKPKKSVKVKKSTKPKKSSKSRKPTERKQLKTKLSSHVKDKHHA